MIDFETHRKILKWEGTIKEEFPPTEKVSNWKVRLELYRIFGFTRKSLKDENEIIRIEAFEYYTILNDALGEIELSV